MQTLGVSVRRSACDRCRGQKLRWLREGTDTCDRCAKANAQCITSPIYRMRNYNSWLPYCEEILEASSSEDLICFDPDVQNNEAIGSTYSYTEQLSKVNLKLVSLLKQISRGHLM
jgi:hypothetical protein